MLDRFPWLRSRRWLVLPPILFGLLAVVVFASSRKKLTRVPASEEQPTVKVVRASRSSAKPTAIGYGTAGPSRIWTAVVEVPGTIIATHPNLRSGVRVAADELLVEIDERDYRLRATQRAADLASAKAKADELLAGEAADIASLGIEEEIVRVTEKELLRLRQLVSRNSASRSEVDRAESELLRQRQSAQQLRNSRSTFPARIAAVRASVDLAQSRLEEAERDLDRTTIVAPFGGVLAGVATEPQQFVGLSTKLFEIHDIDRVEIKAEFSPSQILPLMSGFTGANTPNNTSVLVSAINEGYLSATVTVRSGQAEVAWKATPIRLAETINATTRTLGIVVSVDNTKPSAKPKFDGRPFAATAAERELQATPDSPSRLRLYPGMFCEVKLTLADLPDSKELGESDESPILIPVSAISRGIVYVVDEDNRLRSRHVQLSFPNGNQVAVYDSDGGVREGDLVVIKPPLPTIEGMLVEPKFEDGTDATSSAEKRP